MEVCQVCIY